MKRCENCAYCKAIYVQDTSLDITDLHYCTKKEVLTELSDCCEGWVKKGRREYDLSDERFEKAKEDLKAIFSLMGKDEL